MKKILVLCSIGLLSATAQGQIWAEVGDAPDFPVPGQITFGIGPLTDITGSIASGTDADMYCIIVTSPTAFFASTVGTIGTLGDTQLFLFDLSGLGMNHNDDAGGTLRSHIYAGGPAPGAPPPIPVVAGTMYGLAISGFDRDPVGAAGEIWSDVPFGDQTAPDGAGGPLTGWAGTSGSGTYTIHLGGATFCTIPGPGSLALLALGGLVARRRRR